MKKSKVLTGVLLSAVMMSSVFSTSVFATEVTGAGEQATTVPVTGSVSAITMSVTVPTTLSFAINPNNDVLVTSAPA